VKVLSTSALRGEVREVLAPHRVRLAAPPAGAAGVAVGMRLAALGGEGEARVLAHPEPGLLELDGPLELHRGCAVELRSDEEAPVLAARVATATAGDAPLPRLHMRLATTRGTNALLERRGAPVALFVTRGFGDLLTIGDQRRPDLFELEIRRPPPLESAVVEVPERVDASGAVLHPLDDAACEAEIARLHAAGVRCAAIALLHAHLNPAHERALGERLRRAGFDQVVLSSEVAREIGILPRAQTALLDAYLAPLLRGYVDAVTAAVGGALHLMTSAGGLVGPRDFHPRLSLLSGPAGGVVGAAAAGRRAGHPRVIGFDMGGTSTDVARYDGDHEYRWEHGVGDVRLLSPALAIESVAAGGGSICGLGAEGLAVGPASAGASPGPACYGAGGPLTLTDANLLLGRLDPWRFPIPIRAEAAYAAAEEVRAALATREGRDVELEELLAGFVAIADERMADAIRSVSVRRGYDPAEHALVAFGGAGGQHACGVAERLGMRAVLVPADAGILSAVGLSTAVLERFAARQLLAPLAEAEPRLDGLRTELEAEARAALLREGVPAEEALIRRRTLHLRFVGQESTVELPWEGEPIRASFERRYAQLNGHLPERLEIEVESARVVASQAAEETQGQSTERGAEAAPSGGVRVWFGGGWQDAQLHERSRLRAGGWLRGPALVQEAHGCTLVPPGWEGEMLACGALRLTLHEPGAGTAMPGAVRGELFAQRFTSLVEEMGEQLRRTALSTNVRERLDFSCALLDPSGALVANAPHIPVHLGALGVCVRAVREAIPLEPGDVAITNHPAFGGSHLPDVTVITPVHSGAGELLGYVASRAHHAEIGGTRPGSFPADARSLVEEGVVIPPLHLVRKGEARWAEIRELFVGAPHPTRAVEENLSDLAAQVAANHRGAALLRDLAGAHGAAEIQQQMTDLAARAQRRLREALRPLAGRSFSASHHLDDGSPLRVRIAVEEEGMLFDFAGSGPVHTGNLNATPAVVRSAVLYVLRTLVREPLPLNEGLLRGVEIRIPEGMLNPVFDADPARCPAVVGGNTETSQRLVNLLLAALEMAAGSQGTMNNILFGDTSFGYYETVCGGAGATPGAEGTDAVHTHMTNTRITDPEVLEHRYPVRLERFAVRRGSGGAGRRRGGDGAVRELTFLRAMELSLLAQHREAGPRGGAGGGAGAPGHHRLLRVDGHAVDLPGAISLRVEPGDMLTVETPGGGGWGTLTDL
jgi:5-oxoprolinase (ATP-hydrolysing)